MIREWVEFTSGLANASKQLTAGLSMQSDLTRPGQLDSQRSYSVLETWFERSGVGLHSGVTTQVRVLPAEPGEGRYFVRVDLPGQPRIPATETAIAQTVLSTELASGSASVCTVEHLLAALLGMGVEDARIELDGPEVPLLDGSAQRWVEAILAAGLRTQDATTTGLSLMEPIWVYQGDAFVAAIPSPELRFTYGIDFELPAIGKQWFSWSPGQNWAAGRASFAQDIAPARTFGLAHQIEFLQSQGLIKGGSLENALVCGREGWLNPPLRFVDEPVRHKLLDLIGDLSLLGTLPSAHYLAYKASHALHTQLVRSITKTLHNLR